MIAEGGYGSSLLDNLGNVLGGGAATDAVVRAGGRLVPGLLGARTETVTGMIAGGSGVRRSSVTTMLGLAAPIVMSVIGKQIAAQGLDGPGLLNMLAEQRTTIMRAAPAGLASLFGARDAERAPAEPWAERAPVEPRVSNERVPAERIAPERIAAEPIERERTPAGAQWWPAALLAGLAALGLLFYFARARGPEVPATSTETPAASVRQTTTMTLPGGKHVTVGQNGPVYQLGTFLADTSSGAAAVPKHIVFDDLNFETGSARLTPASQQTVDALVSVLQAYPSAQVSLEGHTDSTGDPTANKTLSMQRAQAVKDMLVRGGVTGDRVTVEGYGQDRPVAPNDTEAGRARNRRLELVVLKR
jgi:outer membrane protein OmpA-like peptidoglycan-associated protein